ncbi:LysR family transcriptional regulator [Oceanisphaera psychrotolerans]|uniref:LysR family transcriptional regulator n=1 Tax=Oceanisphaera psychrotolerans TaxID=1414654 RepID=A0A1J4QEK0_9GAMM|nr:LysR family transcriptional regulator [Oceanisphaera psychrotolerans]OIN12233.1 LysR family transcriptional regulator [Oceanisphaera psychrotolerans]
MDRITAIRSFIEVARTGSFTKAAGHLNLSRLQVSRHVQEVESWLEQRLLHRTTRRVSLTDAGADALARCDQILLQISELEARAQERSCSLVGVIRISSPIGFAQHLLLEAVELFTTQHPRVRIEIEASDRLSELVDERLDIALRFVKQPDETLIGRPLIQIDSVVCATPEYLGQHPPIRTPQDLSEHNCLVHLDHDRWTFVHDNRAETVRVDGTIRANDMNIIRLATLHHQGVSRLPCDLANPLLKQGVLVPLLAEYHLPGNALWAVYLSRSYQTPVVRSFIDFLAEKWQPEYCDTTAPHQDITNNGGTI